MYFSANSLSPKKSRLRIGTIRSYSFTTKVDVYILFLTMYFSANSLSLWRRAGQEWKQIVPILLPPKLMLIYFFNYVFLHQFLVSLKESRSRMETNSSYSFTTKVDAFILFLKMYSSANHWLSKFILMYSCTFFHQCCPTESRSRMEIAVYVITPPNSVKNI